MSYRDLKPPMKNLRNIIVTKCGRWHVTRCRFYKTQMPGQLSLVFCLFKNAHITIFVKHNNDKRDLPIMVPSRKEMEQTGRHYDTRVFQLRGKVIGIIL